MSKIKNKPKVVVVGGGFGGIEFVKKFQQKNPNCQITLVSNKSYFEYFPALYKLVTGAWALEASVALKDIFDIKKVQIVEATFSSVDTEKKTIKLISIDQSESFLEYDYLVLALGSETNFFNIAGLPEFSFSFKSVASALGLKKHFCDLFEHATTLAKEELVPWLHIIIVGAGPSGVELAGDLRSYLIRVAKDFSLDPSLVTIDLIEAANRVLPTMSEKVSEIAEARLRAMGVNIFLNRALKSQDVKEVIMGDMEMDAKTVIWTAGTKVNSAFLLVPNLVLNPRKRATVSDDLSLPDQRNIFIIGDGAGVEYSGVAQSAIAQGKYLANHLSRILRNRKTKSFQPKAPAFVVPIGVKWAIFTYKNFVWSGLGPWVLRSLIDFHYFMQILSLSKTIRIFKDGKRYHKINGGCPLEPLAITDH